MSSQELIIKAVKYNIEAQRLFNAGEYKQAHELKNYSNMVLDGFNPEAVGEVFSLVYAGVV